MRAGSLLLACTALGCSGASSSAAPATSTSAPALLALHEPRDGGVRYRTECVTRADPNTEGMAEVQLAVVAEDEATLALRWRRALHSLWGRYGPADCVRVEGLWLAKAPPGGARVLVARTDAGFYFLDPSDGGDARRAAWSKLDALPVLPQPLAVTRIEPIAISRLPGFAFLAHIRNAGAPLLVEARYRSFVVEASRGGTWKRIAEDTASDAAVSVLGAGEEIELMIPAELLPRLRGAAGEPLRVAFVVRSFEERGGGISAPLRALVTLPADVAGSLR